MRKYYKNILLGLFFLLNFLQIKAQDWEWAVGSKGYQFDYSNDIVADEKGNVYISGYFTSPTFSFDSQKVTNRGKEDGYLAKFDEYGNCIWLISFGGEENERPSAIAIWKDTLFVVGYFESNPATFGNFQISAKSGSDIFMAAILTSNGTIVRVVSYSGDGYEEALSISIISSDEIFVGGEFSGKKLSLGDIELKNFNYDNQYQGMSDGFVAKINSTGKVFWAFAFGGVSNDRVNCVVASKPNTCYFLGTFNSNLIVLGNDTLKNLGYSDVFLGKLENYAGLTPQVRWARSISGIDKEFPASMTIDFNGVVCISGEFQSPKLKIGNNELINNGSYDFFIAKYDNDGNPTFVASFGGQADDYAKKILSDGKGNIYIGGYFASATLSFGNLIVNNRTSNQSYSDVFVAKLDIDNNPLWVKTAGGDKEDQSLSIALDKNDHIYQTGNFESKDMYFKNFDLFNYGYSNVFLAKINPKLPANIDGNSPTWDINISPNPCRDFIIVENLYDELHSTIEIYNSLGEKITLNSPIDRNRILLEGFPSGIFFLKIKSKIIPFIKEK